MATLIRCEPSAKVARRLIAERLDAAVAQLFLGQLAATTPAGVHVVLAWDGPAGTRPAR